MSELEAARVAADAAESSRAALQQQLSALVEQKERAELSTDMVTRQTQVGGFKPLPSRHEGYVVVNMYGHIHINERHASNRNGNERSSGIHSKLLELAITVGYWGTCC